MAIRIGVHEPLAQVKQSKLNKALALVGVQIAQYWKFLEISGKNVFIGFLTCFIGRKFLKTFFPEISKNFHYWAIWTQKDDRFIYIIMEVSLYNFLTK